MLTPLPIHSEFIQTRVGQERQEAQLQHFRKRMWQRFGIPMEADEVEQWVSRILSEGSYIYHPQDEHDTQRVHVQFKLPGHPLLIVILDRMTMVPCTVITEGMFRENKGKRHKTTYKKPIQKTRPYKREREISWED